MTRRAGDSRRDRHPHLAVGPNQSGDGGSGLTFGYEAGTTDPHRRVRHRSTWCRELRGRSYDEGGYPWTRLGYTYDWAPDASERGASEFVIPAETTVQVASFTTTDEYCR